MAQPLQKFGIALKKIMTAYADLTFMKPLDIYHTALDKVIHLSQTRRMRTGPAAAVTLPTSIMLRRAGKSAKLLSLDGKLYGLGFFGGLGGASCAWWLAGNAAFNALSATGGMLAAYPVVTIPLAAAITAPVFMPMVATGIVAIGLGVAAMGLPLSLLPAAVNIGTGIARSKDWYRGIRNQNYGEIFSDDPPPPLVVDIADESSLKGQTPVAPVFNGEAATTLDADITYKKIKLKVKAPVVA